ncbi:MAG: hypothetical protein Q9162_002106 [Coniocarpon cinnabarinum]
METSSPLASLQPNHPGHFGQRCREFNAHLALPQHYEHHEFNFKDMSMLKSKSDYFSYNPMRGSSPTTSLAADLSQNFHIEQSPAFPTPRRTLFNHHPSLTGLRASRDVVTPPIPSSSPGPDDSHMEATPLPHKPPRLANTSVPAGIPTPEPTPLDDMSMDPPSSAPGPDSTPPSRPALGHQRRISNGTRPSLRKGYSMNQVSSKANGTAQISQHQPPFIFGPGLAPPPKPILEDFADSPPSERKLPCSSSTSDLSGPCVPKLVLNPENGSPIGPMRRHSSARGPIPRIGLGRRTQSLQCSDSPRPLRQEKRCCTEGSISSPSVEDLEAPTLSLPHFKPEEEVDPLPRITQQTLLEVLNGTHRDNLPNIAVIDCRFEYEFEGGHINGAHNFNDKDKLASELFDPANLPESPARPAGPTRYASDPTSLTSTPSSRALIFHCEYSHHRAPLMARFIRQHDRIHNKHRYPHLTYPEIYILEGGYASFFKEHPYRCFPQSYVEMESKDHEDACERGMAKVKRRAKLTRAVTYAFGQSTGSQSAPIGSTSSGRFDPMPMLEDSPLPPLPLAPFPNPSRSVDNFDAMDLDEEMDEAAKRRSITFDSPCVSFSHGATPRWLSRNSSY